MKHLRSVAFILSMIIAAPIFTSCLDSDDDNNDSTVEVLTAEQKRQAIYQIAGNYTSSISYTDGSTTTVTWNVGTDSVITVTPFPMKAIINALTTSHPEASTILSNASTQKIQGVVHPLYSYSSTLVFYVNYEPITFTVGEGDDQHNVTITPTDQLTISGTTTAPYAYYANSQMQTNILLAKVTIDGVDFTLNGGFSLTGVKQ